MITLAVLAGLSALAMVAGRLLRREQDWLELAEQQRAREALERAHGEAAAR